MRKLLSGILILILILALAVLPIAVPVSAQTGVQNPPSNLSFTAGRFVARNYRYPGVRINQGNNVAGAATITMSSGSVRLQDGRTIVPFSAGGYNVLGQPGAFPAIPITVGTGGTQETVTPTAVSGCFAGAPQNSCQITATFTYAHGQGEVVVSGSVGIQEAINDAAFWGGGVVVVDGSASVVGGGASAVTTIIKAALPMPTVSIEDDRGLAPVYWNPQGGLTTIAAPTTLTATTAAPSATPAGSYGTGTYHLCISYVDLQGQEGPCSADFSEAGLSSGSFIFTAPAASTGAVGYTIYISLTSGTYTLSYKVPITSTICTMTTLETTTAACAVANTSYGQSGATATVTAITVNTSPIAPQSTIVSSTTVYVPNPGGRTTVTYAASSHLGTPGTITSALPYTISAAPGTTVPTVVGTINLAPGLMNNIGRQLTICGYMTGTATAATIENVQLQWDAVGQNTAGKGVLISNLTTTTTFATTGHLSFCADLTTTVAGASATAGSILSTGGFLVAAGVDLAATVAGGGPTLAATTGSLNLAGEARINVIYLHTTATDGAGWILQSLVVK